METTRKHNRMIRGGLVLLVLGMLLFSYAHASFFRRVCQRLGIATPAEVSPPPPAVLSPRPADRPADAQERYITIQFMGGVASGLPIDFYAVERLKRIRLGEVVEISYRFENRADTPQRFRAVHRVAPPQGARHLKLHKCFCSSPQEMAPHEEKMLPVVFSIDPALPRGIHSLTLSYTLLQLPSGQGSTP
ncbi:MAG: cytochrome c oxidase assembly protein [Candidatus Tectomicrobia bacterium]|uniref:Cytochrome c oxidase assembly protein CtaG n=1 Tax=Tectimicrobiota bacterium TaxID=2528274 RepID=A0A932FWQ0_UNCTE|nr:cytochrome c oxidase assembly protein [Candidatus Tectomicrobia bacterium]